MMKTNLLGQPVIDEFRGDYWFLSNFYPASFRMVVPFDNTGTLAEGMRHFVVFPTAEHAYQAFKADTLREVEVVAAARTPADAKRLGGTVSIRDDWETIKVNVMSHILYNKFTQSVSLQQRLLETGDAQLIEGNTWGDKFWGVCDGEGKNHLGILLMDIRHDLRTHPLDKQSLTE